MLSLLIILNIKPLAEKQVGHSLVSVLNPHVIWHLMVLLVVIVLVISYLPARFFSRIPVVQALRHYQQKKKFLLDTYIVYQGWKNIDEFSPYGEDNESEATRFGFPGWWTANIKGSYDINKNIRLMLTVENLFNTFYKPYASGISGPGRNFIFTARLSI